jgi:hypothetical protein
MDFKTARETRLLLIQVARPASRKFGNQISGTMWIDGVSLRVIE